MNGLTAFILGAIFSAIVAVGIIATVKKRKNNSNKTSGGGSTKPVQNGKPEINNKL